MMRILIYAIVLASGGIYQMAHAASNQDEVTLSDRIGTLVLNFDGTIIIDLDSPVPKEHAHLVIPSDHPDHNYLLVQAGRPKPGISAILHRVIANVTMRDDGSIFVEPMNSNPDHWRGVHISGILCSKSRYYKKIIDLVGPISSGYTLPIISFNFS